MESKLRNDQNDKRKQSRTSTEAEAIESSIPFSAFWLRSSVVSVLISLISDTWAIGPHDIKLIFFMGRVHHSSLLLGLSRVAHALHYCKGLAHPPMIS
uniref:Uncharacterized protein n=1 Tax=Manihot esculenta TaxID=3983 RepID=A0A2C9VN34_MANES